MYSPFFLFLTVYTVWVYSKGCVGVQGDFLSKNVYVFMVFDKKKYLPLYGFDKKGEGHVGARMTSNNSRRGN